MSLPKWFDALSKTLDKFPKAKTYTFATIEGNQPRVRYIVHRSFIQSLPNSPLLVSTTDIRTPKAGQILTSSVTEVAWWIEEPNEQYRISARAHLLPHPSHESHSRFPLESERFGAHGVDWWEKERVETFDEKMGGALRASFCRPVPGSALPGGYDDAKAWPEKLPKSTEVEEGSKEAEQVDEALKNFALLVLEPIRVDRVELSVMPNRRTVWELTAGKWDESIVVP